MSDKTANPYSFYTSPPNYPYSVSSSNSPTAYNSDQEFKDALPEWALTIIRERQGGQQWLNELVRWLRSLK